MRKLIAAGALLAFTSPALAQEAEAPEQGMTISDAFQAMDANGDEAVTQEEFTAYAGPSSEPQFEAASGGDGELTEQELVAFVMSAQPSTMR